MWAQALECAKAAAAGLPARPTSGSSAGEGDGGSSPDLLKVEPADVPDMLPTAWFWMAVSQAVAGQVGWGGGRRGGRRGAGGP